ncbi:MAG: chorismate-binding protein, partial [Rhodocyclaceae bacterium]
MHGVVFDGTRLLHLRRRLRTKLAEAPPGALISIAMDIGRGEDWLAGGLGDKSFNYWAQPAAADCRLGLGRAISIVGEGPERFADLQSAFAELASNWVVDSDDPVSPAAFLGFAFSDDQSGPLPNALLTVPSVMLQCRNGRCCAILSCIADDGESAIDRWMAALHPGSRLRPAGLVAPAQTRIPTPLADREWLTRVNSALADIAAGKLTKVVLTRRIALRARQDFAVGPILRTLARRQPASTVFGFGDP